MKKFVHVESDEEIEIDLSEGLNFACCDCALVHEMSVRVDGEKVFISFRRNNRKTSALRRYHGIPMLTHPTRRRADSLRVGQNSPAVANQSESDSPA